MSKFNRVALILAPVGLLVAVLGYAVFSMWQVRQYQQEALIGYQPPAASVGTTAPLNPSAPTIVAETLPPTGTRSPRGTIIFDMSHSEVFGPQDTSDLGQSKAVDRMRAAGYAVKVTTDRFSAGSIGDDVAAVFLPGPMVPFSDKERSAIDGFVRRGGTVVLTIHVPFPVLGTPARYGLPVGTGVMVDPSIAAGEQGVWVTDRVSKDSLMSGVKSIKVVSGWPVGTSPSDIAEPRIVLRAPKGVVVDANGNGAFDAGDPQPPYGIVGVANIGSGRVVVLGDDAIFANIAIDANDNALFLDNVLELVSAPKPV